MSDLLELALEAHGGRDRWRAAGTVRAHLVMGGPTFVALGQPTLLADLDVAVDVHTQRTVFTGFTGPHRRGIHTPDRVAIEEADGTPVQERRAPRDAFPARDGGGWDPLHALYSAGYGLWNYLTTPWLLTWPGVVTRELEPDGPWRRLGVTFPPDIATHSSEQTFSFDGSGLLRRLEYAPFVMGGRRAEHHTAGHVVVDGLVVPTHRTVFPVDDDGRPGPTPIITLELADLAVEPAEAPRPTGARG